MIKLLKLNKIKRLFFTIIILGLIMLSIPTNETLDTDDWEDTFNSPDSLKNWNVPYGKYAVDQGVLVASNCYAISGFCLSSLWRNNTSSTGTWSFDLRIPANHSFFIYYFIGISATLDGFHPDTGYAFHIDKNKIFHLRYRQSGLNPIISSYTTFNETKDWMHFDITRDSKGKMEIFLNHLSIISGQDNRYTFSENINFQLDNGAKLDNVSYKTTTTISNSPGFDSTGIILSFMVVFVIIKLRKKKK